MRRGHLFEDILHCLFQCSNVVHTWRSIHIVLGHLPESNDHVSTKVYEMVRSKGWIIVVLM